MCFLFIHVHVSNQDAFRTVNDADILDLLFELRILSLVADTMWSPARAMFCTA